jgi:hypothetical protein
VNADVKLPDGSTGKFRADATDAETRAALKKDFPGAVTRTVEIPEAARKWMRPGAIEKWKQKDSKDSKWVDRKESEWVDVATGEPGPRYTYPADVTTDELVSFIQSNDLLPRPEFSVRASFLSHRMSSLFGLALAVAGIIGNGLLLLRLRKSRSEARVLPA